MLPGSVHLFMCLAGLVLCTPNAAKSEVESVVAEIIGRTRQMQGTYSVYMWNEVTPMDKAPFAEWSAEFHSGNLHRVENPNIRIIANCKTMSGTFIELQTQKRIEGPQVAKMACGINANPKIRSARKIGAKRTAFGKVTVIELTDASERRTYDVTDDGILLGSTIGELGRGGHVWVVNKAIHVSRDIPASDIFSVESLEHSFVAQQFRQPHGGK